MVKSKSKQSDSSSTDTRKKVNETMGDISSFITSGFGALSGATREVRDVFRTKLEANLHRLAIPTREEFAELTARVDALQKRVNKLEKSEK